MSGDKDALLETGDSQTRVHAHGADRRRCRVATALPGRQRKRQSGPTRPAAGGHARSRSQWLPRSARHTGEPLERSGPGERRAKNGTHGVRGRPGHEA